MTTPRVRAPAEDLDDLLDRIPVLAGRPRSVVELTGGLTNQNLRVTTSGPSGGDYVVRRFRGNGGLLGIDRDAEHANTVAAAQAGVGAPVIDYLPDLGVLVIGYLPGRTYDNASFAEEGVLERVADALRRLHRGPRFTGDFDMVERRARFLRTMREHGWPLFAGYDRFDAAFSRAAAALAVRAEPTVPCNNDLLAGNFVDDGERLWLIDYEYSGNNDAFFELGNTATECDLDDDQVEALTTAYVGRHRRSKVARVRLQALVSAYGWALWGAIQASSSSLDFDFDEWGRERFEKAARGFTSAGFDTLLEEVTGDD
ncbi:MAG TPA: phosphotransferase [Nocardioidaceae bacterium]|nr:phosphotransferase [Nocardioidaceae bacterium]